MDLEFLKRSVVDDGDTLDNISDSMSARIVSDLSHFSICYKIFLTSNNKVYGEEQDRSIANILIVGGMGLDEMKGRFKVISVGILKELNSKYKGMSDKKKLELTIKLSMLNLFQEFAKEMSTISEDKKRDGNRKESLGMVKYSRKVIRDIYKYLDSITDFSKFNESSLDKIEYKRETLEDETIDIFG